jgi:NTE family protein
LAADVGYQFNARTELRAGEGYQWFGEHRTVGNPIGQEFDLTPLVTSARFQYLGQDDVMLPTKGSVLRSNFNYYTQRPNSKDGLSQLNVTMEHFIPSGKRGILFGTASGGTSFGASNLGLAGFSLGGPLRLTAYDRGELLGDDYFLGQAGYLFRLSHLNPIFGDAIYAGGFYELGKINGGNSGTPSVPNDGTAIVVMKTLIGPIYGGGSIGGSGHYKWYFGLGRFF